MLDIFKIGGKAMCKNENKYKYKVDIPTIYTENKENVDWGSKEEAMWENAGEFDSLEEALYEIETKYTGDGLGRVGLLEGHQAGNVNIFYLNRLIPELPEEEIWIVETYKDFESLKYKLNLCRAYCQFAKIKEDGFIGDSVIKEATKDLKKKLNIEWEELRKMSQIFEPDDNFSTGARYLVLKKMFEKLGTPVMIRMIAEDKNTII